MKDIKIDESILESLEDVGFPREEAERIARAEIKKGLERGILTDEDLEYLGTPLILTVTPQSGTINTTFTFTVSGANPKHEVHINVKKGLTKFFDPIVCKIPAGRTSCKQDGKTIVYLAKGILPGIAAAATVNVYAREKSWWIDKKSAPVILTISKGIPIVSGVVAGAPGMKKGMSFADLAPLPPPYPPIPRFIGRMLKLIK